MSHSSRFRIPPIVLLPIVVTLLFLACPGIASANTLQLAETTATGRTPFSVVSGDVNGDLLTDIVVGNFNSGSATIYYQLPAGGFSQASTQTLLLPVWPGGVRGNVASVGIGDVDGNGLPDIVLSETVRQFVWVYLQTAPGVFLAPTFYVDINGNLSSDQGYPAHPDVQWLGSALTTDEPVVIGQFPWGNGNVVQMADLDDDGASEIIAPVPWVVDGNPQHDRGGVYVAKWAAGSGADPQPQPRLRNWFDSAAGGSFGVAVYPGAVKKDFGPFNSVAGCVGDFNNDGYPDVLLAGEGGIANFFPGPMLADRDPLGAHFGLAAAQQDFSVGEDAWRAASGDLNGDLLADAVITGRSGTGGYSVVLQDDYGHLGGLPATAKTTKSNTSPGGVKIGDITGDGRPDVTMANASWDDVKGSVSVIPQLRPAERLQLAPLGPSRNYVVGRYPEDVAIGDFNANEDLANYGAIGSVLRPFAMNDVVVVNSNDNTLMLLKQVKPEPPGIEFGGASGSSVRRSVSAGPSRSSAAATAIWISNTRPKIQLTDAIPADMNGVAAYYYIFDQLPATFPTPGGPGVKTVNPGTPVSPGSDLGSGTWYLHVLTVDKDGNVGTVAAHYQLNIDTTPPAVPTPTDGYAGAWSDASFRTVTWPPPVDAQSGIKDYLWAIDGQDATSTVATSIAIGSSGPPAVPELTDGVHVFSVKARDNSNPNNVSASGSLVMRVDAAPPLCDIQSPKAGALVSKTMVVNVNATDTAGIARVEFWMDGVLKATLAGSAGKLGDNTLVFTQTVDTGGLVVGPHTLSVHAFDMFGHETDDSRVVNVDNTVPKFTKVTVSPNPFFPIKRDRYKDDLYVRFRLSKPATVKMTIENVNHVLLGFKSQSAKAGSGYVLWNGRLIERDADGNVSRIIVLGEGTYYIRLQATDAVGNVGYTPKYKVRIQKYVVQIISGSRVRLIPH